LPPPSHKKKTHRCINFANEKLQQKFTQDVFQTVQEEYKSEGLEWELISYRDNSDVLDLLEGRLGVWAMLNEECLMPQGSDGKYLGKLSSACSRHPCFGTSVHMARDEFSIQHFAGKVLYNVTGFVERNRDALPSEMKALMQTSRNDVLCQIYSLDVAAGETDSSSLSAEGGGGSSRDSFSSSSSSSSSFSSSRPRGSFSQGRSSSQPQRRASFMKADTVTTKFRAQLLQLMEVISLTDVQYVRCIKPNSKKSKELFDRSMVVGQLRCAGMIEAIRISRAAYPYRITHSDFTERFGGLRSGSWLRRLGGSSPLSQCKALLEVVLPPEMQPSGSGSKDKQYELGKTRVYFSSGVLEYLEGVRGNLIFRHIGSIQRVWRGTKLRRWYLLLRRSAILTQAAVRGFAARLLSFKARFAIIMTQSLFRGWRARRRFRKMQVAYLTVKLQAWARMVPLRRFFVRLRRAASTVGARVKMCLQRKKFVEMLHEARENAKMATQLDALRRRLQDEAARRAVLEDEVKRASIAAAAASPASSSSYSSSSALAAPANEIEALEHLRSELGKQQRRVELLSSENESLRQGLRGGTRLMDLKEGALAVGRVALEDLEREKAHLVTEKDKMSRVNAQYNLEKSVLMDSLLELGNDVDEAQRKTAEFFRRFIAERQIRKAQHQATCDFLSARGVGSDVLEVRPSPSLLFLFFLSLSPSPSLLSHARAHTHPHLPALFVPPQELTSFVALSLGSEAPSDELDQASSMSEWEASFLALAEADEHRNDLRDRRRASLDSSREGRRQHRLSRRHRGGGRQRGSNDYEGGASDIDEDIDGHGRSQPSPTLSTRFDSDTPNATRRRGSAHRGERKRSKTAPDLPPRQQEESWFLIKGIF
jgi:myosin heavy subunit